MRKQSGFTLIELMIVVAIIAILAAIAIPQYNDYTARAQLSEAATLAASLKTPIMVAYSEAPLAASCVVPGNAVASGRYVDTLVTANGSATGCDVVATMKSGIAAKASGRILTLSYDAATSAWSCTSDAPSEIKPKACS